MHYPNSCILIVPNSFAVFPQAGYGGQVPGAPLFPGQQFLGDPLAGMAMQYGQTLAGQGKELVNQNVSFCVEFCFRYFSLHLSVIL